MVYEEEPSKEKKKKRGCDLSWGRQKEIVLSLLLIGYLSCTDRRIMKCVVEYFSVC